MRALACWYEPHCCQVAGPNNSPQEIARNTARITPLPGTTHEGSARQEDERTDDEIDGKRDDAAAQAILPVE